MLLNTNKYIPQVYGKTRDIQVLTKLLDIILTDCKYDIDSLYYIYDGMKCKEEFLPVLGATLNYQYDYTATTLMNRRIIDAFVAMEKYKGSQIGLKVATALSLVSAKMSQNTFELDENAGINNTDYAEALGKLDINFDREEGLILIDYPNIFIKATNLIDYVRPVGMCVVERSYDPMNINSDVMLLYADTDVEVRKYNPVIDSGVSKNFVNFSTVGDPTFADALDMFAGDATELNLNN
jgi:phage tail-like protein